MIEVMIDARGAQRFLTDVETAIESANAAAIRAAAAFTLTRVKLSLSFTGKKAPIGQLGLRTGKLRAATDIKLFRQRNGLDAASIRPAREQQHILRFHEYGTVSHGRYPKRTIGFDKKSRRILAAKLGNTPLPARMPFALTFQGIQSAIFGLYEVEFSRIFDQGVRRAA